MQLIWAFRRYMGSYANSECTRVNRRWKVGKCDKEFHVWKSKIHRDGHRHFFLQFCLNSFSKIGDNIENKIQTLKAIFCLKTKISQNKLHLLRGFLYANLSLNRHPHQIFAIPNGLWTVFWPPGFHCLEMNVWVFYVDKLNDISFPRKGKLCNISQEIISFHAQARRGVYAYIWVLLKAERWFHT